MPMTQTDDSAHWSWILLYGDRQFVCRDGFNCLYVRNEGPHLVQAFRVAPNCLDCSVSAKGWTSRAGATSLRTN